jgi:hypothetical protein
MGISIEIVESYNAREARTLAMTTLLEKLTLFPVLIESLLLLNYILNIGSS